MSVLDWLQQYLGGGSQSDPGTARPQSLDALQRLQAVGADSITPSFDRPAVPDTGVGTYWHNANQAIGEIGTAAAGLAERFNKGTLNTLGFRQPGGDIYRGEIPVGPGLQRAGDVATFVTGGLANSLYPTAGALRAGAQYAVPPGTMPGLLADEMGGIRAFHGSPHDFDRFDPSKIGTGEGAQAYGHGLYFAENEGVARAYRDALAAEAATINGVPVRDIAAEKYRMGIKETPTDIHHIADYVSSYQDNARYIMEQRQPELVPLYDKMVADNILKQGGHMYEVDINADPARFLDWDKSLAGQPPDVLTALQKLGQPTGLPAGYRLRQTGSGDYMVADALGMGVTGKGGVVARGRTPEDALRLYLPSGEEFYKGLARKEINGDWGAPGDFAQRLASDRLREAGIPGIRYLDQGSRGAGQGSSNYAVFDDKLISILRKYGIAGLLGGGSAATAAQDY